MKQIIWYKRDGQQSHIKELNNDNLQGCHGQLVKCYLKNNKIEVGYADIFRCGVAPEEYDRKPHDYIYLWTWKNINEETHELEGNDDEKYEQNYKRIEIIDIVKVQSILYSNPRWRWTINK